MKIPLLVPELRELIRAGDSVQLRAFCESTHPPVVAEFVSALEPSEAWAVIRHAELPVQAEIFSHFDEDYQVEIMESMGRAEAASLLTEMAPDDRADLFKNMSREEQDSVMPGLAQAEREDIRRLAAYEEGTAGAVMTSDYATVTPAMTAAEAVEHLREVAPDKETIYYSYVVDDQRRLLGYVSLKDLILAPRDKKVAGIMRRDVIYARAADDQEDAARKIQKFDLIALPVVNERDVLVGIITHDDALDVITQEQTEDIEKLMAIAGEHEAGAYLRTSAWTHFRNRAIWLLPLALLGLVSAFIVESFEVILLQFALLVVFMPMLAGAGGNTGSQSATLVVRALALKEVVPRDVHRILGKEFQVALLLGLLLGGVVYARVLLFSSGENLPEGFTLPVVGIAIAVALGLQVVTATVIGALLPLLAAKMKWDPALVASPALTTVVDITGLLIYFTAAKLFLGI